jgi:hypothetical protein
MDQSGEKQKKADSTPDSGRKIRQSGTAFAAPRPGQPLTPGMTGAELRLYAWSELPESHRNEVCRQIRVRCESFISMVRVDRRQWRSEVDRLLSEVAAHLLRATSVRREEATTDHDMKAMANKHSDPAQAVLESRVPPPWLAKGRCDAGEPTRDARVIWVVEEICSRQALFHRYEDMRRRDGGGKWDGSGYPLVAVDNQTIEQLSGRYDPTEDETDSLQARDSRRAWLGLVALVEHQFGPDDDVVALVKVLAEDRDTQDSFSSQWPIGKITRALNKRQADDAWSDDRVDNAKRRLTKSIVKIKRTHGLDAVDLRALLVRYARECDPDAGRPQGIA